MEYLTADNIQTAFIALGYIIFAIRQIIKWSSMTKDDELLAKIDNNWLWVSEFALSAYHAVERLSQSGQLPKVQKAFIFMKMVKNAYEKEHNKSMPKFVESAANLVAQEQAAIDKANLLKDHIEAKLTGTISPNDVAKE